MRFSDTLGLALQNVLRTRLRTTLTATGVAIGTAAVVTLLAFGNGVQAIAVGRAASFGAVTTVLVAPRSGAGSPITPAVVTDLRAYPHVRSIVLTVTTPSLRVTVAGHSADLTSIAQAPLAANLSLAKGSPALADAAEGVLLPASQARKLAADPLTLVGQPATLTAGSDVCCAGPGKSGFLVAGPDRQFASRIAGIWDDSGVGSNDRVSPPAFVTATTGATIDAALTGKTPDQYLAAQGYGQLYVYTDDARATAGVASHIRTLGFFAQDRSDLLAQINLFFNIIKAGLGAVGGIALLVAAVGIANTMVMTVLERTHEIGIMKALGAEPGGVRAMFLVETGLVGVLGGVVGLLLAFAAGAIGNAVFQRFMASQNPGVKLPDLFVVPVGLMAFGVGIALAVSLAGGFLPARRAVRLEPLDALRYE
ncbi:MAG TPA: ABC transporter permease [Candidatus Dormibacteraeota bacterium]|jgi:ABC-type antimicrobial peptide transport system permease subunit|nr:ABC transporter permease [Candidatus Dormibacteraeota bacterium]